MISIFPNSILTSQATQNFRLCALSLKKFRQIPFSAYLVIPHNLLITIFENFEQFLKSTSLSTADTEKVQRLYNNFHSEYIRACILYKTTRTIEALYRLQSEVNGFALYKEGRTFVTSVQGMKFSRKKQIIRYLYLFSDCLVIAEAGLFQKKDFLYCHNSGSYFIENVDDIEVFGNCIDIRTENKSFRLQIAEPELKNDFLEKFSFLFKNDHVFWEGKKENTCAPVWIPDDAVKSCQVCGDKFNLIIRRHHCRSCGKCICTKCCKKKTPLPWSPTPQPVCDKCFDMRQEE